MLRDARMNTSSLGQHLGERLGGIGVIVCYAAAISSGKALA